MSPSPSPSPSPLRVSVSCPAPGVPGAGPRSVQLSRHTRNPNTGPNKGHEVSRAAAGIGRRARCELIAKLMEMNVNVEVSQVCLGLSKDGPFAFSASPRVSAPANAESHIWLGRTAAAACTAAAAAAWSEAAAAWKSAATRTQARGRLADWRSGRLPGHLPSRPQQACERPARVSAHE